LETAPGRPEGLGDGGPVGPLSPRIFTVGHGTKSSEQFVEVLKSASVGRLVDARRFPGSRRHPHFGRAPLELCLAGHGVCYEWWGEELGGRRSSSGDLTSRHSALVNASFRNFADHMDTPLFRAAFERLCRDARADPPFAIMCAETLWWRCHRRLISDALVIAGVEVIHLIDASKHQAHRLHPAVRGDDRRRPVYDVGALPLD
jgi:uncharacterized protein (DUF488 family)